jgi:hypothetical protein
VLWLRGQGYDLYAVIEGVLPVPFTTLKREVGIAALRN